VRCGRSGHIAAQCWATRHNDGSPLPPNGVKPPAWFIPKNRANNSSNNSNSNANGIQPVVNDAAAPDVQGLASYQTNLNVMRDVAQAAPRPNPLKPNF
jgi:hypothetical protein